MTVVRSKRLKSAVKRSFPHPGTCVRTFTPLTPTLSPLRGEGAEGAGGFGGTNRELQWPVTSPPVKGRKDWWQNSL
jgi:hypothetical protein